MARKQKQPKAKRPKTVPRRARRSMMPRFGELDKRYIQLLRDPCNAPLAYGPATGSSDSGYLTRLYYRYVLHNTAASNSGVFAWYPGFHCTGAAGINTTIFESSTPATPPLNSSGVPFGSGAPTTSAAWNDPAGTFLQTAVVAGARTVAACARVYYTGSISNCAGTIGVIPNAAPEVLLHGNGGGPIGVNDAITMSPRVQRVGLEPREVRWTPSFRDRAVRGPPRSSFGEVASMSPFLPGVVSSSATSVTAEGNGSTGIIIAWSGLPTNTTGDLIVECYKVIEWMPDAFGAVQPGPVPRPLSTLETIVSWMDDTMPHWRESLGHVGAGLAERVLSGQTDAYVRSLLPAFGRLALTL